MESKFQTDTSTQSVKYLYFLQYTAISTLFPITHYIGSSQFSWEVSFLYSLQHQGVYFVIVIDTHISINLNYIDITIITFKRNVVYLDFRYVSSSPSPLLSDEIIKDVIRILPMSKCFDYSTKWYHSIVAASALPVVHNISYRSDMK